MIRFQRISRIAATALIATGFALPALAQGGTAAAAKPAPRHVAPAPVHRAAAPAATASVKPADPGKPAAQTTGAQTTGTQTTGTQAIGGKTTDVKPAVKPAGSAAATAPAATSTPAPRATN